MVRNEFKIWLEQKIATQREITDGAKDWFMRASESYRENREFFGNETDRGEMNAAQSNKHDEENKLRLLERILEKFLECEQDI